MGPTYIGSLDDTPGDRVFTSEADAKRIDEENRRKLGAGGLPTLRLPTRREWSAQNKERRVRAEREKYDREHQIYSRDEALRRQRMSVSQMADPDRALGSVENSPLTVTAGSTSPIAAGALALPAVLGLRRELQENGLVGTVKDPEALAQTAMLAASVAGAMRARPSGVTTIAGGRKAPPAGGSYTAVKYKSLGGKAERLKNLRGVLDDRLVDAADNAHVLGHSGFSEQATMIQNRMQALDAISSKLSPALKWQNTIWPKTFAYLRNVRNGFTSGRFVEAIEGAGDGVPSMRDNLVAAFERIERPNKWLASKLFPTYPTGPWGRLAATTAITGGGLTVAGAGMHYVAEKAEKKWNQLSASGTEPGDGDKFLESQMTNQIGTVEHAQTPEDLARLSIANAEKMLAKGDRQGFSDLMATVKASHPNLVDARRKEHRDKRFQAAFGTPYSTASSYAESNANVRKNLEEFNTTEDNLTDEQAFDPNWRY